MSDKAPPPPPDFPGAGGLLLLGFLFFGLPAAVTMLVEGFSARAGLAYWCGLLAASVMSAAFLLVVAKPRFPIDLGEAIFARGRPDARGVLVTLGLFVACLPTTFGLYALAGHVLPWIGQEHPLVVLLGDTRGLPARIVAVLFLAGVAPMGEEIFFRGVMLGSLSRRHRAPVAVACSAVTFSLLHLPSASWIAALVMGVVLGWWVLRTRVLAYGMLFHVAWNGTLVAIGLANPRWLMSGEVSFLVVVGFASTGALALAAVASWAARHVPAPEAPASALPLRAGDRAVEAHPIPIEVVEGGSDSDHLR